MSEIVVNNEGKNDICVVKKVVKKRESTKNKTEGSNIDDSNLFDDMIKMFKVMKKAEQRELLIVLLQNLK